MASVLLSLSCAWMKSSLNCVSEGMKLNFSLKTPVFRASPTHQSRLMLVSCAGFPNLFNTLGERELRVASRTRDKYLNRKSGIARAR